MESKEIKKVLREQRYINCLFKYGVLSLLKLLEEYEQEANYEECQIILNAINFVNNYVNEEPLPTRYSDKAIEEVKEEFDKWGFTGEKVLENLDSYIDQIKKFVG